MEQLIPYRFRSANGTVRIYAPKADFNEEWTSTRHRFLPAREIDEQGADIAVANIVSALTRSDSWGRLQSSVCGIDDIDARTREHRLAELRSTHEHSLKDRDELLELYEAEHADQRKTILALEEELQDARERLNRVEEEIGRLEFKLEQANASAHEARETVRNLQRSVQAVSKLERWPESPSDLAGFAAHVFSERLAMTEKALKSLATSSFAGSKDSAGILWRCLRAMANELHPLLFERGELSAANISEQFTQETIFELAWTETKQTKRDNKLVALRRMDYRGQEVEITPHVKWGKKPPKCLRVHFWVDRERKQLVIGHCGDHLDTYGTRRRK